MRYSVRTDFGFVNMDLVLCSLKTNVGTSLVVHSLRIHLPMLGTRVQSLVREDPTYRRATKLVRHNY